MIQRIYKLFMALPVYPRIWIGITGWFLLLIQLCRLCYYTDGSWIAVLLLLSFVSGTITFLVAVI